MYQPQKPIATSEEVQSILGEKFESQEKKAIDHIDSICAAWIERSPFITIATVNLKGQMDVAPKGDPAGFVKILDEKTLAIPDRLGNHRGDTFHNIIENARPHNARRTACRWAGRHRSWTGAGIWPGCR